MSEKRILTTAQLIRKAGIESIQLVCDSTGISRQTLDNWQKTRPKLFRIILLGVIADHHGENENGKCG